MDDLISREAAIDALHEGMEKALEDKHPLVLDGLRIARGIIRDLPAVPSKRKVEPFTIEEMVMFINMVEMMRKECDKSFYYNPILSSVKQKVRDVFWTSSV